MIGYMNRMVENRVQNQFLYNGSLKDDNEEKRPAKAALASARF